MYNFKHDNKLIYLTIITLNIILFVLLYYTTLTHIYTILYTNNDNINILQINYLYIIERNKPRECKGESGVW